jgi:hypothetical protein
MIYVVFKYLNPVIDKMWKAKLDTEQDINIIELVNMNE